MEEPTTNNKATNLVDLANKLEDARKAIPISEERLKDKPKSSESYLICKDGTVAETDHIEHNDGRVTIKETIG